MRLGEFDSLYLYMNKYDEYQDFDHGFEMSTVLDIYSEDVEQCFLCYTSFGRIKRKQCLIAEARSKMKFLLRKNIPAWIE